MVIKNMVTDKADKGKMKIRLNLIDAFTFLNFAQIRIQGTDKKAEADLHEVKNCLLRIEEEVEK